MRRALPVVAAALTSLALASCSGTKDSAKRPPPPPSPLPSPPRSKIPLRPPSPPPPATTAQQPQNPLQPRHRRRIAATLRLTTPSPRPSPRRYHQVPQHRLGLRRRQQLRPLRRFKLRIVSPTTPRQLSVRHPDLALPPRRVHRH